MNRDAGNARGFQFVNVAGSFSRVSEFVIGKVIGSMLHTHTVATEAVALVKL